MAAFPLEFFIVGFIAFFATGLDDTLAYAPFLKSRIAKLSVSSGIILATAINIGLAFYFAKYMILLPYPNLIGGSGLIILGILLYYKKIGGHREPHAKHHHRRHKAVINRIHRQPTPPNSETLQELFFAGFATFFMTRLDETIIYAALFMNPITRNAITLGIIVATALDIIIAAYLASTFAKFKSPHKIGAILLWGLGFAIMGGLV